MNNIIINKLHSLMNTPNSENLMFQEFAVIKEDNKTKDINLTRVRGSVRLSSLRIFLPSDVKAAKKRISKFSFK
ncbi:hypothetical protein LJB98_01445 [Bacteroidales bacterium OttesenSCG-928-M11]|nr:hypothetical protein [Bacteroidales bacterium OttesenSCG-928-M11]